MPPKRLPSRTGIRLDEADRLQLSALSELRDRALLSGDEAAVARANAAMLAVIERTAETDIADVTLRDNERLKLSALYVNTVAAAVFSVGALATLVGAAAPGSPFAERPGLLAGVTLGCVALSVCIHILALRILAGLRA